MSKRLGNALSKAIEKQDLEKIDELLIKSKKGIKLCSHGDFLNYCVINSAVKTDNPIILKKLQDSGIELNSSFKGTFLKTSSLKRALSGSKKCYKSAEFLLENNLLDSEELHADLKAAVSSESINILKELFLIDGAKELINKSKHNNGINLLYIATRRQNEEIANFLIENGADIDETLLSLDKNEETVELNFLQKIKGAEEENNLDKFFKDNDNTASISTKIQDLFILTAFNFASEKITTIASKDGNYSPPAIHSFEDSAFAKEIANAAEFLNKNDGDTKGWIDRKNKNSNKTPIIK